MAGISNRERILQAAVALFNKHGVGEIGTNKIAQHLSISPGNLYYHFKNKEEIIREIFPELQRQIDQALQPPDSESVNMESLLGLTSNTMEVIWRYRFFYADMVLVLRRDPELQDRFMALRGRTLHSIHKALQAGRKAGVLTGPSRDDDMRDLVRNIWIVATSWVRYLLTSKKDSDVDELDFRQGQRQVLALTLPYRTAATEAETRKFFKDTGLEDFEM